MEAEVPVDSTAELIRHLCDNVISLKRYHRSKRPVYWWTKEISKLRKHYLRLRQKEQCAHTMRTGGRSFCARKGRHAKELEVVIRRNKGAGEISLTRWTQIPGKWDENL